MQTSANDRQTPKLLILLTAYFAIWTLLPALFTASYPLDVVEGLYWGHEWQLGYYKHPPLSSWLLYSSYYLFGHLGPYLLSQLVIASTILIVYRLGKLILPADKALLGSLLLLALGYYTWPSLEFNHNIAQLPVWAGLIYVFYLASRHNHWWQWLLFGVLAGAGMLVKYEVAVLLMAMLVYSFVTPYRRLWLTPKPWLSLALAGLIFLPNLIWLWQNDWLPFSYLHSRASEAESKSGRLSVLGFLITQLLNHLPLFIIILATRSWLKRPTNLSAAKFFLLFMAFAPAGLLAITCLILGIGLRDMWGMPMWNLSGLLVMLCMPDNIFSANRGRLLKALSSWLLLVTLLMFIKIQFGGQIKQRPSRIDWPQAELSQQVVAQWQQLSSCPLDSIAGDNWLAGMAATYLNHPVSVLIAGNSHYSPWMTEQRLQRAGTLLVEQANQPVEVPLINALERHANMHVFHGSWRLPWHKLPNQAPLLVHWRAYVPQNCLAQ